VRPITVRPVAVGHISMTNRIYMALIIMISVLGAIRMRMIRMGGVLMRRIQMTWWNYYSLTLVLCA
jgi:hypothetical protein